MDPKILNLGAVREMARRGGSTSRGRKSRAGLKKKRIERYKGKGRRKYLVRRKMRGGADGIPAEERPS